METIYCCFFNLYILNLLNVGSVPLLLILGFWRHTIKKVPVPSLSLRVRSILLGTGLPFGDVYRMYLPFKRVPANILSSIYTTNFHIHRLFGLDNCDDRIFKTFALPGKEGSWSMICLVGIPVDVSLTAVSIYGSCLWVFTMVFQIDFLPFFYNLERF